MFAMPPGLRTCCGWANRAPVLRCSSVCRPADTLGQELAVIRIVVRGRAVAELDIDHARLAFHAGPPQRLSAFRVRRGNQWGYVGLDAEAPIDFVVDREILQPSRNGMVS